MGNVWREGARPGEAEPLGQNWDQSVPFEAVAVEHAIHQEYPLSVSSRGTCLSEPEEDHAGGRASKELEKRVAHPGFGRHGCLGGRQGCHKD